MSMDVQKAIRVLEEGDQDVMKMAAFHFSTCSCFFVCNTLGGSASKYAAIYFLCPYAVQFIPCWRV